MPDIDQALNTRAILSKDARTPRQEEAPPAVAANLGAMGGANSAPASGIGVVTTAPAPIVRMVPGTVAGPTGRPVFVSGGVMAGSKVFGPQPDYPAWARNAHISGDVVLHAIITKTGAVQNVSVVSGPPGLRDSAVTAVKQWRYKPFLLTGQRST